MRSLIFLMQSVVGVHLALTSTPVVASASQPAPLTTDTLITLRHVCGREHPEVCLDSMTNVPRARERAFMDGGAAAIDIVMGDSLPARLGRALATINLVASGQAPRAGRPRPSRFVGAWKNTSADAMTMALRQRLPSITLTTYDDCPAWRNHQNRATDGRSTGPLRVNRCTDISITSADLANTIVHETLHRLGFQHPHMHGVVRMWSLANCEPPYMVGSLVRSIAAATPITGTLNNCAYLIQP